jgi:hypothetical protein
MGPQYAELELELELVLELELELVLAQDAPTLDEVLPQLELVLARSRHLS